MQPTPPSYVYCPPSHQATPEQCRALLEEVGAALWITGGAGVPSATLLPTLWHGDRLLAHASGHNEQFQVGDDPIACRVVIQAAGSYVSPRWYPSVQPAEHGGSPKGRSEGRAVGTWNYRQVQIAGWLRIHRDVERLRREVTELGERSDAERFEGACPADAARGPWHPDEAPADFMAAQLRGIVGLELQITEVVGRFKLSRNRTELDRTGIVEGLRERGRPQDLEVADATESAEPLYRAERP